MLFLNTFWKYRKWHSSVFCIIIVVFFILDTSWGIIYLSIPCVKLIKYNGHRYDSVFSHIQYQIWSKRHLGAFSRHHRLRAPQRVQLICWEIRFISVTYFARALLSLHFLLLLKYAVDVYFRFRCSKVRITAYSKILTIAYCFLSLLEKHFHFWLTLLLHGKTKNV